MMTGPVIRTRVKRVFEQIDKVHVHGVGDGALFEEISRGWFVAFENSYEALFWGDGEPDLRPGDLIEIRFKKLES